MDEFENLWRSLDANPGRVALVVGEDADRLMGTLASWKGIEPTSVSRLLTVDDPDGWRHPERNLRGHKLLLDLEVLFWPEILADPLSLLRMTSRHHPVIALWPGSISDGRAIYSEPGRSDYYDEPLVDEFVLRARPVSLPTDVPYDLEIAR